MLHFYVHSNTVMDAITDFGSRSGMRKMSAKKVTHFGAAQQNPSMIYRPGYHGIKFQAHTCTPTKAQ
jgi:hypothetical protein